MAASRGIKFARRRRMSKWSGRITRRRMPSLFPDNCNVIFKFKQVYTFQVGTIDPQQTGQFQVTFRLNDCRDPNVSTLHNSPPNAWNHYAQIYKKAFIYKSDFHARATFQGEGFPFLAMLGWDGDVNPPTIDTAEEMPAYKVRQMNPAAHRVMKLSSSARVEKIVGMRLYKDAAFWFTTTGSTAPAVPYYWQLKMVPSDPNNATPLALPSKGMVTFTVYNHTRLLQRKSEFYDVTVSAAAARRSAAPSPAMSAVEDLELLDL